MACLKPVTKAIWCQTDFEKHRFSYEWRIANIFGRMEHYSGDIQLYSPQFSLLESDDTKWRLYFCCTKYNHAGNYQLGSLYFFITLYPETKPPKSVWVDFSCAMIGRNGEEKYKSALPAPKFATENDMYALSIMLVPKTDITQEGSEYLVDGALNLDCKMTLTTWGNPKEETGELCIPRIKAPQFSLPTKLEEARKRGQLTDVTIVTKTMRELKAHRIVLAAHSSVLRTKFEERWQQDGDNKVDMTDMDDDVLDAMLTFLYTGDTKVVESHTHEMLQAADKYDIEDLKAVCEEYISNSLTVENAVNILELADTHNAQTLKEVCIGFIRSNNAVLQSEGWRELKVSKRNTPLVMEVAEAFATFLQL